MKRWKIVTVIVGVIIFLIIMGYLFTQGYFENFEWQTGTMILAALAAPYQMVANWLKPQPGDDIGSKHEKMREEEKIHREKTDKEIELRKTKIQELDKELEVMNTKIKLVEVEKSKTKTEVDKMTPEQLKSEGQDLFGEG